MALRPHPSSHVWPCLTALSLTASVPHRDGSREGTAWMDMVEATHDRLVGQKDAAGAKIAKEEDEGFIAMISHPFFEGASASGAQPAPTTT